VTERAFRLSVAALAALRILPAIVVAVANGRSLPLLPGYAYGPPNGDTYGFYAAAREFISSWRHISKPLLALAVLALAGVLALAVRGWRRGKRAEAVTTGAVTLGLFTCLGVRQMGFTGAGAVGWPIVWSVPLFPLRVAGHLSYHTAYYIALVILLACNVVTIVATAAIGRHLLPATYALIAPALLVLFPTFIRLVDGTGKVVYGTWLTDSGQTAYSEPLSTALVVVALALIVVRPSDPTAAALAGALAGFSIAVRVSNAPIAAVFFLALVLHRRLRPVVVYTVAGIGTLTIALAFWSKGYASFPGGKSAQAPDGLFSIHYLRRSWADSAVFDWKMLAILLPLPVLGVVLLRRRVPDVLALAGTVIVTAALYSAYYITALHPRFLFVALPPLFVLAAAGVVRLTSAFQREIPPG
jgi:hypothetical protein